MQCNSRANVVVIGGGLAGLGAAVNLARAGRRVTLLEAADALGGCCSTRRLSGYRFNTGALYVAVPSALRAAFLRLGLDFDADVPLVPIANPHCTVLQDGTRVHISSVDGSWVEGDGGHRRTSTLRQELNVFRRQWSPVYHALVKNVLPGQPSMSRMLGFLWRYLPRMAGSVERVISRYFSDAEVQAAVASTLLYTGTAPARLPAAQIIGLLALLEEGFYLPRGGMGAIPAALRRAAEALCVSIHYGARVERIAIENERVRAVELADGERIEADCVLSTCSGFELAERMLPGSAAADGLRRRARRTPLSHRAVSIQLGCRNNGDIPAFIVNHVPSMAEQGDMHVAKPGVPRWFAYTNPTATLPELAPAGKAIIELYAPVSGIASVSDWTKDMTKAALTNYIEALQRAIPQLSVEVVNAVDPQTFHRQIGLYEGALYGVAPGANPWQFFPHRTGIKGLYIGGQTTFPGYGVPSAILSGIHASDALLADA